MAGIGSLGVPIQDCDNADFSKLDCDCAVVTINDSLETNWPAYQRLLGQAGVNVMCLGGQSYYPHSNNPELADRIDALAKARGVSFSGGGVWDASRIWSGLLAVGPCTQINSLYHRSVTDVSRQIVSFEQTRRLAVGISEKTFWEEGFDQNYIGLLYRSIPEHVLMASGYHVQQSEIRLEPIISDREIRFHLLPEPIRAGDCRGTRIVVETQTHEGVSARCDIELRLIDEGETEHMMWKVDGRPSMTITVERDDSRHFTAGSFLNRIPQVVAAPPGIVLLSELGPLQHSALLPAQSRTTVMAELRSFCRLCLGTCGTRVELDDDGRILTVRGDRDHAMSRGYVCMKGVAAPELHNGPDRILQPLKRVGDGFTAISSEQALDEIAARIAGIRSRSGPDAIALYNGTQAAFNALAVPMAGAWMAALGSRSTFSTMTVDQSAKWVAAERLGSWGAGPQVWDEADVWMFFGTNPLVSIVGGVNGFISQHPDSRMKAAKARGMKLIVIDPRCTETAEYADVFLQARPGEDATIAAAMLRLILAEGWEDKNSAAAMSHT